MKHDNFLYKYTTCEAALKIFSSLHLRWSCPNSFNDPFDSIGGVFSFDENDFAKAFEKYFRHQLYSNGPIKFTQDSRFYSETIEFRKLSREMKSARYKNFNVRKIASKNFEMYEKKMRDIWEDVRTKAIAICFAEEPDHPLMWSHYAQSHCGIVIKFKHVGGVKSLVSQAKKITYSEKYPTYPFTVDDMVEYILNSKKLDFRKESEKNLYQKSSFWDYENEWRCIRLKSSNKFESYELIKYYPREVDSVYLGMRISDNNEKLIRKNMVGKFEHVHVQKAVLGKRSYNIKFE